MDDELPERVLKGLNGARRTFLRKPILGAAFVVPLVAFSMSGPGVDEAHATTGNESPSVQELTLADLQLPDIRFPDFKLPDFLNLLVPLF
jgi:hypothetical protein